MAERRPWTVRIDAEMDSFLKGIMAERDISKGEAMRILIELGAQQLRGGDASGVKRYRRIQQRLVVESVMILRQLANHAEPEVLEAAQEAARDFVHRLEGA